MSEIERVNITLPKKLLNRSKILIKEGLFSNFSELVRESIKSLLLRDAELIDKKEVLRKLLEEDKDYDVDLSSLSSQEIIAKIRQTRDKLWEEKYHKWFK